MSVKLWVPENIILFLKVGSVYIRVARGLDSADTPIGGGYDYSQLSSQNEKSNSHDYDYSQTILPNPIVMTLTSHDYFWLESP